jgi:predicted XRE-type DNA-binding protein
MGSSRKDLQAMPDEVQDTFGYALYLAQTGGKHVQAKPLKGFGRRNPPPALQPPSRIWTWSVTGSRPLWRTLASEDQATYLQEFPMSTITIEQGSGNVYADIGMADAQEMLIKAKLASKIGDIIKRQNLTQQQAAELLAMPQPKVSMLLRGQFRGISEAKMLECLARLGRDIDIVVKPARRRAVTGVAGRVNVVFA